MREYDGFATAASAETHSRLGRLPFRSISPVCPSVNRDAGVLSPAAGLPQLPHQTLGDSERLSPVQRLPAIRGQASKSSSFLPRVIGIQRRGATSVTSDSDRTTAWVNAMIAAITGSNGRSGVAAERTVSIRRASTRRSTE